MTSRHLAFALFVFAPCAAAAGVACGESAFPTPPADARQLEEYLESRGLTKLQAEYLELRLATSEKPEQKSGLAERLVSVYSRRMFELEDETARHATRQRIDALLSEFPSARTPATEVLLLETEYTFAERDALAILEGGSRGAGGGPDPQAVAQRMADIGRRLIEQRTRLEQDAAKLEAQLKRTESDDARQSLQDRLHRLLNVAGRGSFFIGWHHYYLAALAAEGEAGAAEIQEHASAARKTFRKLLGIEEDRYEEVSADWLQLDSLWLSKAVIGLALTEAVAGDAKASERVFSWLEAPQVPPTIRDQAASWRLTAALRRGDYAAAAEFARREIRDFPPRPTQGRVSFCVTMFRSAADASPDLSAADAALAARLGAYAVEGLAVMREYGAIRQLAGVAGGDAGEAAEENSKRPGAGGFYAWLNAQRRFSRAERTQDEQDYAAAAAACEKAAANVDASATPRFAEEMAYLAAWTAYRRGRLTGAAPLFERVAQQLREADPERAAAAAWMSATAYRKQTSNPAAATAARRVLSELMKNFPKSQYAAKANYLLGKMAAQGGTGQADLEALKTIPPEDPNYVSAQYDLALACFERWRTATDAEVKSNALAELAAAVDRFLTATTKNDTRRRLQALLLLADAGRLAKDESLRRRGLKALEDAAPLAEKLAGDALVGTYHTIALKNARREKDATAIQQHAAWLAKHGQGDDRVRGMILRALEIDREVAAAPPDQLAAKQQEALAIFSELADHYGTDPETLRTNRNAQASLWQKAQYAEQLGKMEVAGEAIARLRAAFPKVRSYLQAEARLASERGDHEAAFAAWGTLVGGAQQGSGPFFEAKYHQLQSLSHFDPAAAAAALQQFKLLYPGLGDAAWAERFRELERKIR